MGRSDGWSDRTIEIELTPGGGGSEQVIDVPNWVSDDVRIPAVFRDFVAVDAGERQRMFAERRESTRPSSKRKAIA